MSTMLPDGLEELIPAYLGVQRWFAGPQAPRPESVRVERSRELWTGDGRRLWQAIVAVAGVRYHLLIGERPAGERADFLHGREEAVLGSLESQSAYFYDAALDAELARVLLQVASGGSQTAALARPMAAEQSNTSLVFDDRVILKVFRRLHEGRNPDVQVTSALAAAGFAHVATPLLTWREEPYDLAFGQQYLAGGSEGWALALTSLRDLYSSPSGDPSEAGGDFAAEARRLGRMTAEMHLALVAAFGQEAGPSVRVGWADLVDGIAARLLAAEEPVGIDAATTGMAAETARPGLAAQAAPLLARLRAVPDPGPAIRVHGDYHLGQVMRTDAGWFVLDFEGEPAKPLAERTAPTSPLKDVSSMLRSFDYAARYALLARPVSDLVELEPLAQAWESHNRRAFLEGYRDIEGIDALLADPASTPAVMIGYELDKALYELDYERAHRPEWVPLPLGAIRRLVDGDDDDD
jgi:maltokinase